MFNKRKCFYEILNWKNDWLTKSPLNADVLARDLEYVELVGSTSLTEVGVALAYRQITGTLLSVALGLASTTRESILTFATALAELLAKVLCLNAGARVVAWSIWMIAWGEVVHVICSYVEENEKLIHIFKVNYLLVAIFLSLHLPESFLSWILRQCIDQSLCFFFFFLGGVKSLRLSTAGMSLSSFCENS